MGTWARLFGTEKRLERRDALLSDHCRSQCLPLVPGRLFTDVISSEAAISRLAVAARCVSLISEGRAALPPTVYRKLPDGGREAVGGHPLSRILNDTANDGM